MSIVSQICADAANEVKNEWVRKFDEVKIKYGKDRDSDEALNAIEKIVEEIRNFHFSE